MGMISIMMRMRMRMGMVMVMVLLVLVLVSVLVLMVLLGLVRAMAMVMLVDVVHISAQGDRRWRRTKSSTTWYGATCVMLWNNMTWYGTRWPGPCFTHGS